MPSIQGFLALFCGCFVGHDTRHVKQPEDPAMTTIVKRAAPPASKNKDKRAALPAPYSSSLYSVSTDSGPTFVLAEVNAAGSVRILDQEAVDIVESALRPSVEWKQPRFENVCPPGRSPPRPLTREEANADYPPALLKLYGRQGPIPKFYTNVPDDSSRG